MSAGILRNWYLTKLKNARYPVGYMLALNNLLMYEWKTFKHNTKTVFTLQTDK